MSSALVISDTVEFQKIIVPPLCGGMEICMNHGILSRMKRSTRKRAVSAILVAAVLALLVAVNLLVGLLPAKVSVFDVSGIGITEISDETEKFVSDMEEDVTIYWLCADGVADDQFELLLTRYEEAGKHIRVEVVDTTANPAFVSGYTENELSDFSVIVESGRRYTTVETADMYYYVNDFVNEQLYSGTVTPMTAAQLEQIYTACLQYYQIDITQYPTYVYFRGEALITSALDYVTRPYIPHGYLLTGHGEAAPSEILHELMHTMGMDVEPLDLSVAQAVPTDANCLLLFSPETDLSAHETTLVRDYLNAGGSLMLSTDPATVATCPNIGSLGALFGMTAMPGVVEEGDTSYISGSRFTLLPTPGAEHTVSASLSGSGYKAQMPNSHAIAATETLPSGVVVTPLLTTSETANRVAVEDPSVTLGEAGKLHVAMAATKSISLDNGTADTAHLIWFGSAEAFTDAMATNTSGGNYYYYAASVSFMSEPFTSAYEGLRAVDLSGSALTGLTDGAVLLLGAVAVILIPAGLLTAGILIWVRRKKR